MFVKLEDIKEHLQVEYDYDDYLILNYIEAAEEAVKTHCNVSSLNCLCNEDGELQPSVRQAIYILVGHFYQNREVITFGNPTKIPYSFEYLIALNQTYYGGEKEVE